ncbi:MAG: hypothetical protein ACRYGR_04695 [Janthinobacterium lividum]
MNLERAIRMRQISNYTKGEKISSLDDIYEQAILSTQQRQGHIKVNFETTQNFPKSLVLRAIISGIPFQTLETQVQDYSTKVQYVTNGQARQEVPFYALSSVYGGYENLAQLSWHKAVELRYCDYGLSEDQPFQGKKINNFNLMLKDDTLIYQKDFHLQTKSHLIQRHTILDQNHWVVSDAYGHTRTNGTSLFAYGGIYRSDLALDRVMPTFAIVAGHQNLTHLILYSLLGLKDRYVMPPKGGICGLSHWYFADNLPPSYFMSLSSCLQEGFAEIILEDQKTQETCRYISKNYTSVGVGNKTIDITFIPKLKGNL